MSYSILNTNDAHGMGPNRLHGYAPMDTDPTAGFGPQMLSDTPDIAIDSKTGEWWSPSYIAQVPVPQTPPWVKWAAAAGILLLLAGGK